MTTNPTGPQRLIDDERSRRLREAIEELPPKQRLVLELRIYDELRFKEVAELVDCSENAAKVLEMIEGMSILEAADLVKAIPAQ